MLTDVLGKHSSSQLGRATQTSSGSMCKDLKLKEGGKHRPWALGHRCRESKASPMCHPPSPQGNVHGGHACWKAS